MDEQRFDQIAKRLGQARTRRSALKGLGLAVLGAAGLATGLDVEAKGKSKRQHARDVQVPICVPGIGGDCNVLPCCAGLTCASDHTCQCNLGACETNDDCTCAHVTTCGTFGSQAGTCCRSDVGLPCFPKTIGGDCCGPNLVCSGATKGICRCNKAAGFINNNGVCECPSGQHVNDAGQCVADETCVPDVGGDCSTLPCCTGLDCESNHTCQCHLGACHHNSECTCAGVETCGTFGDTTGQCCRTQIGIYCQPGETGSECCAPAYVCDPHGAGCQCNTAAGFVNNNGVCECPAGQHVSDAGQCVPDETCIQPGQTCNACHQCCAGSTCSDPNHACDGSGGTCCLNNGQQGNSNHPDLCCSGCVCPDGNCCDASHCHVGCQHNSDCGANQLCCNNICVPNDATNCGTCGTQCSTDQTCVNGSCQNNPPQCNAPLIPCGNECINPDTQCCAEDEIGVLCPEDPRGQRKCCPAGHTCNPNKNGTFNCGKGHGAQPRHNRGRNRR